MTQDEIIKDLITKGIVDKIGDAYFITEKYKELLTQQPLRAQPESIPTKIKNYDSLLNQNTNGKDWPIEVLENKGRVRVTALMDVCQIPTHAPDGSYRLRGVSQEAVNVLGNISDSDEIDGTTFIAATTYYYKNMDKPKGFKNYLLEGEALDVYTEFITGELQKNLGSSDKSNQTWR